ncbi:hypothetical protein [Halobacterium bonnevillei]|uniref:Envelope protein N-terminal domain-containing protein n=1 Tax=Halobacterium bonnevillei TaxID=2692200 RepID=A0A6B0SL99_9EURY|nr:hypothetical protein [Halobacterium bonnevillei]MXR20323.1 hypothetical protein [Halobacterium bonnevillei]
MSRGPSLRGVGVVLMAVGLVTALAGGGFLGPGAESALDEASPIGSVDALGFTAVVVLTGGLLAAGYVLDKYHSGADGDSTVAVDANETYQEVHHQSTLVDEQSAQQTTILNNTVRDGGKTLAWTKGKAAFMDALGANKSKAVAQQWASENVTDYYTVTEMNLLRQWNASMKEVKYLHSVYNSHSDLSTPYYSNATSLSAGTQYEWAEADWQYQNYTLANGSTIDVQILFKMYPFDNGQAIVAAPFKASNRTESFEGNPPVRMKAAYGSDSTRVIVPAEYKELLTELNSSEAQMSSNIEAWSNQTYDAYEAGTVNITDIPDPVTLAQEFATDYDSTGHYAYAGGDLALMGVQTNMNTSFTVEIPSEDKTLYGQLYTDWEPASTNGTLDTGHLYNVSKTDELVFMATNDGLQAIGSDFKITSMTDVQTGEDKTSTTTESYNTQTSDVSLTEEQLQQLIEIRDAIQDREEAAASGGGFFDGLGLNADVAVPGLVVAAGAALVLLGRT